MFDGHFRAPIEKGVAPVGRALRSAGVTPDHLTALGLVVAVGASVAIATGNIIVGLVLVVCAALPDMLDGAVAKAGGTASLRGAFFDSVADRATDALLFGGLAWYLGATRGNAEAMLAVGVLATSSLISYQRAKAESLGFDAKGGIMERAERVILLCVGLAFGALLVPILVLMLALTSVTAVQRFVKVWRQASAVRTVPEKPVPVWRQNKPRRQTRLVRAEARRARADQRRRRFEERRRRRQA
jgi:CDP-diacylglycerol---glycerol-3-phosphate 3-phosphatidyltransferase